jgi:radical SAM superfamily enzyme YgiQ (UPF0313 family)
LKDLASALRRVERPARYVGGEFGAVIKEDQALSVAISYPDLYEIGMSNSAVKILYNLVNGLEGVACERVFAPAPDFEAELRAMGVPLYSLETGKPLASFDILGFSLGYELTFTNLLSIIELGGISLMAKDRGEGEPVVLMGGPAATNPAPYGDFIDCVFIGEAEGWAEEAFSAMAAIKRSGAAREDLLGFLRSRPSVWWAGKTGQVRRSLWKGFASTAARSAFPVPNMRVVQDHGTVEIMRGCPNACRFCHASCLYRPVRHKEPGCIEEEVRDLVLSSGYREITLSSLSSGEFHDIHEVVGRLNAVYISRKVSFSLPSLHIDSLGLALLSKISEVRKSGLTFAVETPLPGWQEELGKPAPLDKTVVILKEAKNLGWKNAKFYFMVGLPASFSEDEAGPIIEYLREVRAACGMMIHVNIASFIPKPHTPYERAAQLTEAAALERIMTVRKGLKGDGFKIGYHAPFLSILEGIICRGDGKAGRLVLEAYRHGARLDAWEEHIRIDIWRDVISRAGWDVEREVCRKRDEGEELPWRSITLRLSESETHERKEGSRSADAAPVQPAPPAPAPGSLAEARVLFSFVKSGTAAFISHLDLMTVFERALARSPYSAVFTEGFNPKPRMEFASPLGLGIDSDEEFASVEISNYDSEAAFISGMNAVLPPGIRVTGARIMARTATGKKPSLMAAYWGSEYRISGVSEETVAGACAAAGVKAEHATGGWAVRLAAGPSSKAMLSTLRGAEAQVRRVHTLASRGEGEPVSYFELFSSSLT